MTTVRVWDEVYGWMHEVWDNDGKVIASSKHLDELQEQFPDAKPSGVVLCGCACYLEGDE